MEKLLNRTLDKFFVILLAMALVLVPFMASGKDLPPGRADETNVIGGARDGADWQYVYATKVLTLKVHTLDLTKAFIDTGTDALMGLDGTTAPGMAIHDSLPKAVWASPETGETYALKWTFLIPDLTVTVPPGKTSSDVPHFYIKAMVSSSGNNAVLCLDGTLYVNSDETAFNSGYALDAVSTETADSGDLDTENRIVTLSLTTAAKAALSESGVYSLVLWPCGTPNNNTEVLAVWVEYK